MKLKTILLLLLLCNATTLLAQDKKEDCQQFRTGIYQYINDSSELIIVKRTKRFQEERNHKTGQVDKMKIKWTSDCAYEIKQYWSSNKQQRKNKGQTSVQIVKTYEDRYDFTCACKNPETTPFATGTMIKIK